MTEMDADFVAQCRASTLQRVQWADDTHRSLVKHVGVNHRGADICMAEEILHRPDVLPGLQKMGRKAMAQRV